MAVGPQRNIFALVMYISCCLSRFFLRWIPNANAVLSGIWALVGICGGSSQKVQISITTSHKRCDMKAYKVMRNWMAIIQTIKDCKESIQHV